MSEAQKEVSRFVSEQKREADTVARNGQRTLDEDKGAHASHAQASGAAAHPRAPAATQRTWSGSARSSRRLGRPTRRSSSAAARSTSAGRS